MYIRAHLILWLLDGLSVDVLNCIITMKLPGRHNARSWAKHLWHVLAAAGQGQALSGEGASLSFELSICMYSKHVHT